MTIKEINEALRIAQDRQIMPTTLSSAELRDLSAGLRARAVFTARGSSAVFATAIKKMIEALLTGNLDQGEARLGLAATLRAIGYTPEGGFPDGASTPPVNPGTIQDIKSFRRLDLIVRTQTELMQGAGQQLRGQTPERLRAAPAWELIRVIPVSAPRDWKSRFEQVGGKLTQGRIIALKGDPVWGELGSNFDDSLDVDHPPFAFNSGMGWEEVTRSEARALGITGPDGMTTEEFQSGIERPQVILGNLPLPTPQISVADLDPQVRADLEKIVQASSVKDELSYDEILEKELAAAEAAYNQ